MFNQRFFAPSLVILLGFCSISGGMAQRQDANTAKVDQLFDTFMRRGDLPVEFTVSVYRTSATGLGPHIGTILVRNSFIKVGGRDEPALIIKANLVNLTPGPHAFHIHENPDCGPKAKDGVMVPGLAAGAHLFAEYKTGGIEPVTLICKSHLGNLPNLLVNPDGTTTEEIVVPRLACR
ncbi:MAG: superoxide dismutase family protein [Rhodomicrobium sp.]